MIQARGPLALSLLFALTCAPFAMAQGKRDPERAVERYREYLEKKPYHAWAFDKLVEAAVSRNGLKQLVASYSKGLAEEPDDLAARVVLSRLYARTGQLDLALETLNAVKEETAEHLRLLGALQLRRGEPKLALAALDRAVTLTDPKRQRKLLSDLQQARGEAALGAGERAQAASAFRAMAVLSPENFNTRLEVAALLSRNGLAVEAIEELKVAKELAGSDASKRCRVLAQQGRLHEQQLEIPAALSAYREALGLMGRGNWLERELQDRILAIHQRGGSLAALEAQCQASIREDPQDIDARRFLARVLSAGGSDEGARDVLRAATAAFPEDLRLGRDLLQQLEVLGDTEGRIAEYQRLLGRHPAELELYLELGKVFASEGRFEQARRQWQRTLAGRLQDATLCLRLAELYAFYQRTDDAVLLYEKAIALRPQDTAPVGDLLRLLARAGRTERIDVVLERATAAAGEDPGRLREVSALWREHGHLDRALELVHTALKAREDPALLEVLADLQGEVGHTPEAVETLHRVVQLAAGGRREAAVDRILRIGRKGGLEKLIEAELDALKQAPQGPTAVARRLVLARAYVRRREPAAAIGVLEQLLQASPQLAEAHQQLARLYEDAGDYDQALEHHRAVAAEAPQGRRRTLLAIARIHLARYEQEKAFACYQEALRATPDNPSAFKEIGEAYERIGRHQEARECFEQAVRLKPEDAELRLRLAWILRQQGELALAKEHILAAVQSKNEDQREDARERYYELLAEEGRVGEEIEALRARIDENPYDTQAPLTLADIYVRELEYELALEMLEKLLGYQPRHAGLLEERARLLALMDRQVEAIQDYETLWRLPGGDRGRLALRIADAALQHGDQERARQAVAAVGDVQKVARLYEQHGLVDDAIQALREGVAASPRDPRLHGRLGRLLRRSGDRAGAVISLERVLALSGDRWRLVRQLGDLYHELNDEEQAEACGRRLFALIQLGGDKDADEDEDEDENKEKKEARRRAAYRARWSASDDYRKKVAEIRDYFAAKGKKEVFAELGLRELEARPLNTALFSQLTEHFLEESPTKALKCVTMIRRATASRGKHPPGYTRASWASYLERTAMRCYAADPELAAFREQALAGRLEQGQGEERDWVERVQLLDTLRRKEEALATLRAGLEACPRSADLLLALASRLREAKEHAAAAPLYRRLLGVLDASGKKTEASDELAFRKQRSALLQSFPSSVQRRVSEDHLRRLWRLTRGVSASVAWGLGVDIEPAGVRRDLARSLVTLGERDEALRILAALEPAEPERVRAWSFLAETYFELDLFAACEQVCQRLAKLENELERDPVLGHVRTWASALSAPMKRWARILERRGDVTHAYDVLREYAGAQSAELLLSKTQSHEVVATHYVKELEETERALAASEDPEQRHWLWTRVRSCGVKLAEIRQLQLRWADALALYERLLDHAADDFELHGAVATLHERAGRIDEAVATHWRIIRRKRELLRRPVADERPRGRWITPAVPPRGVGRNDRWMWQNLTRGSGRKGPNVNENYAAILRTHLERKEFGKAAEILRQVAREDASTFRGMSYALNRVIRNYRMGVAGLPILRLLHAANRDNHWLNHQYGASLMAAGKLEEARKVYTAILAMPGVQSYYVDRARKALLRIEARLDAKAPRTLADLRQAASSDPKNIKKRLELARRLAKERSFTEALEEVRTAQRSAPQQGEISSLLERCLIALGRRDELAVELRRQLRLTTQEQDRFVLCLRLANLAYEPAEGLSEEVREHLRESERGVKANNRSYSASGWYIERGFYEEARQRLAKEVEDLDRRGWQSDDALKRLRQLEFVLGDPLGAVDGSWEKLTQAKALGDKTEAFQNMAGTLQLAPRVDAYREAVFKAARAHGGVRGDLYRAAFHLAARELGSAEAALDSAVKRDPKGTLYVHPILIGIARARRDWDKALSRIHDLEKLDATSTQNTIQTSVGRLTEREALLAERGSLELLLGRERAAREAWAKVGSGNERRAIQAGLYAEHDLLGDAIATIHSGIAKEGEKDAQQLQRLAGLLTRAGRHGEVVEVLERARILTDPQSRGGLHTQLLTAYRRAGRLEELRARLEERRAADPQDSEALELLARIYAEVADRTRLVETLEFLGQRPEGQQALEQLAVLHEAAGRWAEAAAALERSLEVGTVQDYQRQQIGRQLAGLYAKAGELERATQALLDGHEDPEDVEALSALASFLMQQERYAEASETLRQVLALDPEHSGLRESLAEALEEAGQPAEALEQLWLHLTTPVGAVTLEQFEQRVVELVSATGAEAAVETRILAAPSDPSALLRGALLDLFLRRTERAGQRFEAILKARPGDLTALAGRLLALRREGATLEALPVLDRFAVRLELEAGISADSWRLRRQLASLQETRGRLLLEAGKLEDARKAFFERPTDRYAQVEQHRYSYYNTPDTGLEGIASRLMSHGMWSDAVKAWERAALVSYGGYGDGYVNALYRQGERERALTRLWRRVDDPGRDLAKLVSNGSFPNWAELTGQVRLGALLTLNREEGRTSELIARLKALREREPERKALIGSLRSVLLAEERYEELLTLEDEETEGDPEDVEGLSRRVQCLQGLKRWEAAAEVQGRVLRIWRSRSVELGNRTQTLNSWSQSSGRRVRFYWARASGGGSGGWSASWGTGGDGLFAARRKLMALWAKVGRTEEARALESLERTRGEGSAETLLELARSYAEVDLAAEVVRLCAEARAREPEDLELAGRAWELLVEVQRRVDDAEGLRLAVEGRLALLAARVEAAPYPWPLLRERAWFVIEQGGDPSLAEADVARLRAREPRSGELMGLEAWVRLRQAKPGEAVKLFEQAAARARIEGSVGRFTQLLGQGLALAGAGDLEAARPLLRRALAEQPKHVLAREARAVLDRKQGSGEGPGPARERGE